MSTRGRSSLDGPWVRIGEVNARQSAPHPMQNLFKKAQEPMNRTEAVASHVFPKATLSSTFILSYI